MRQLKTDPCAELDTSSEVGRNRLGELWSPNDPIYGGIVGMVQ